ncbi:uncharacterized protein LOC115051293 [Echeneis naucrates]|uniref:uncharacterized protein LOC115051293 n=1 Tax=Echeneis naucrates TaxID=173247 RepID=UPI0011136543|nr:uncharacterized protein LOC115051293 [Echeneis naucrates]
MRLSSYSCLLAFVLGWNVAAERIYKVEGVTRPLNLPCPRPVEGKATWSRVFPNGTKVELITGDDGAEERHNDPRRRYTVVPDQWRSLHIQRPFPSDSGRYLCNNEEAVELTVIPSGTNIINTSVNTDITLNCSAGVGQSDHPEWSKERAGEQQNISGSVSTVGRSLILKGAQREDSGLYRCGGTAVFLNVTKGDKDDEAAPGVWALGIIIAFILLFVVIIIIIIIFCYLRWRRRPKRSEDENALYEEMQGEPSNVRSVAPADVYNLVTFPAGDSNQNNPTYCTINDQPVTANRGGTSQPSDSLYSLAGHDSPPGNNEDSSQPTNNKTYYLLEKPKVAGNNSGGHV